MNMRNRIRKVRGEEVGVEEVVEWMKERERKNTKVIEGDRRIYKCVSM